MSVLESLKGMVKSAASAAKDIATYPYRYMKERSFYDGMVNAVKRYVPAGVVGGIAAAALAVAATHLPVYLAIPLAYAANAAIYGNYFGTLAYDLYNKLNELREGKLGKYSAIANSIISILASPILYGVPALSVMSALI